jgi:hypothetical protein
MVRFFVVKLIHSDFFSVQLIIFSVIDNIIIDSKILLMTDFINLKIKSVQSFKYG